MKVSLDLSVFCLQILMIQNLVSDFTKETSQKDLSWRNVRANWESERNRVDWQW